MRVYLVIFVLFGIHLFAGKPNILVSLAPYSTLVEKIAKDTVSIKVAAPQDTDPHNFEPTIKHMSQLLNADIWFCIGEKFENKIKFVLQNKKLMIVDLRQNLPIIRNKGEDRHFWLSIALLKIQAQTIAKVLSEKYPKMANIYCVNLTAFLQELDNLAHDISNTLKHFKQKAILVTHPAFTYFCKEHDLLQISIERYGKEPTLKEMETIYQQAKEYKIKNIILQPQHPQKGAKYIAQKLHINTVTIDPYAPNFINSMKLLAQLITSDNNR